MSNNHIHTIERAFKEMIESIELPDKMAIVRDIESRMVTPKEKVYFKDREPNPIYVRKSKHKVIRNEDGTYTTPLKTYSPEEYDAAGQRAANLYMAKVSAANNLDFELVKKIELEESKLDPDVKSNGAHFILL